ncbi:MAG: hypothetical protein JW840_02565 [Candidatus Thermoplasmatota archaeon]|nr:hypothetical protein [Candidatus Thermoplasmatota archaeon]
MSYILIDEKTFEETAFDNEDELERAVVDNKKYIFGDETVLIDLKRKVGQKGSKNTGIPDGFLIDFSNANKPQLFFVEYELESHHLYEHIGPQIMRFYASFETGGRDLQVKITEFIKAESGLKNLVENKIKKTPFDNIDSLLNYLIYDRNLGIIVIIDDQTEDFNSLLKRFSEVPEVVVVKKYLCGNNIAYQYNPFREGISEKTLMKAQPKDIMDVDTIVCPAREDGFKHAFLENDAWWAIRISPTLIPQLKYIAMYETQPASQIRWMAKIKQNGIQQYKNTGKYIVNVESKEKIGPIQLDKDKKGVAPQSPRYTTLEKLKAARKISDLW